MATIVLLAIMATGGVVMFARDAYSAIDILFAVFTWGFGTILFFGLIGYLVHRA